MTDTLETKGTLILSLDVELAWGTFDKRGYDKYRHHFRTYRTNFRKLLDLLNHYHIPATFAFVGHLLLSECKRHGNTTHPDVPQPQYRWYPFDWHHLDPGTNIDRDPWWYGTDLLEMVRNTPVAHEIASHTFTHAIIGDADCSREVAFSQWNKCKELHERHGLKFESAIFPRNKIGHLDVLKELGLIAYRGPALNWYRPRRPMPRQLAKLIDSYLAVPPPVYRYDQITPAVPINIPASMFLPSFDGFRRYLPTHSRVLQATRGIRNAISQGGLFHLWFHPFNLGSNPRYFKVLNEICALTMRCRERHQLRVLTMSQFAQRLLHEPRTQPSHL